MISKALAAMFVIAMVLCTIATVPTIFPTDPQFPNGNRGHHLFQGLSHHFSKQRRLDVCLMVTAGTRDIRAAWINLAADPDEFIRAFAMIESNLITDLETFTTVGHLESCRMITYGVSQISPQLHMSWNQSERQVFFQVMHDLHSLDIGIGVSKGGIVTKNDQLFGVPHTATTSRKFLETYLQKEKLSIFSMSFSLVEFSKLPLMLQKQLSRAANTLKSFYLGTIELRLGRNKIIATSGQGKWSCSAKGTGATLLFPRTGRYILPGSIREEAIISYAPSKDMWSEAIIYEWKEEAQYYGSDLHGPAEPAASTESCVKVEEYNPSKPTPGLHAFTDTYNNVLETGNLNGVASAAHISSFNSYHCHWLMVDGESQSSRLRERLNVLKDTGSSSTGTTATPTSTRGSASGGQIITSMGIGLVGVSLGFVYWL